MRFALLLAVAATFLPGAEARAAEPDAVRAQVKADLQRYYTSHERRRDEPSPWVAPLKQLGTADAAERSRAAVYLVALLSQALDDEKSGAARWEATPFFGEAAQNEAHELRRWLANGLEKEKLSAESVPVLRWYLDHEPDLRLTENVLAALAKMDGAEADALRVELVTKPHANAVAVEAALKQMTDRNAPPPTAR